MKEERREIANRKIREGLRLSSEINYTSRGPLETMGLVFLGTELKGDEIYV